MVVRIRLGGHSPSGSGQHPLAVERDLVGHGAARLQAADHDERVVVAGDVERARGVPEHLDRARRVGLDPHRRLVLPRVAEEGTQYERRHCGATLPCHDGAVGPLHPGFLAAAVLVLAPVLGLAAAAARPTPDRPDTEETLLLDFVPNAVHAGIYLAVERSYDEAEGVDLTIRRPGASTDALKLLQAGRVDAAVLDIHDLGLAQERGADLVGVMALVQKPLAAVIAASGGAAAAPSSRAGASA